MRAKKLIIFFLLHTSLFLQASFILSLQPTKKDSLRKKRLDKEYDYFAYAGIGFYNANSRALRKPIQEYGTTLTNSTVIFEEIPPIFVNFERLIDENSGVSACVAFHHFNATYYYKYSKSAVSQQGCSESLDFTSLLIVVRFMRHFVVTNHFDFYGSAGTGFHLKFIDHSSNTVDLKGETISMIEHNLGGIEDKNGPLFCPFKINQSVTKENFIIDLNLGLRVFFTKSVGAYAEFGLIKSFMRTGLIITF